MSATRLADPCGNWARVHTWDESASGGSESEPKFDRAGTRANCVELSMGSYGCNTLTSGVSQFREVRWFALVCFALVYFYFWVNELAQLRDIGHSQYYYFLRVSVSS